ncbi:MAG TPA: hypothetical protein VML96_00545 [Egibacteraceae bacterium]|nr:hypothetical protein [Egibacteraceae bacterium]
MCVIHRDDYRLFVRDRGDEAQRPGHRREVVGARRRSQREGGPQRRRLGLWNVLQPVEHRA